MIEHTPLDVATLSPAAQKALGPGPARMMASRGLVPLPPADQITVLYQLAVDPDQALATAARTTAMGLPDKLLGGALADGNVDPRVLDLFSQLVGDNPSAFEALVGNLTTSDETIAYLAENGGAREVDRIANNEQRLLRYPQIIAAMYQNKHARMSTIDRTVELAVRNHVRVPGLAAWDEIAAALQHAPADPTAVDALFEAVAAAVGDDSALTQGDANQVVEIDPEAEHKEDEDLPLSELSVPAKIRTATIGDATQRAELIRSPMKIVALAAIKSAKVTDFEAARYAANPALSDEVIRYIANKREWTKLYGIKFSLCRNPKTPVVEAMRLLPSLRERDLGAVATSRGIPSAVVAQAKKLMMQRRSGSKKPE